MEILNTILSYILIIGTVVIWVIFIKNLYKGVFGIDIIAGVALISTLIAKQYLAGVVILLMFIGGQLLEEYAMRRAKRELSLLISRNPRSANLKTKDGFIEVSLDKIKTGDLVLSKPGEIVAVDGVIVEGESSLDEAVLTGESNPVFKSPKQLVYAGTENISNPIIIKVLKEVNDTKYSEILHLVKNSESHKAKIVRLADKYSVYFTLLTFLVAGITWFLTGDFIRVISVLVVATPCPLLIATPVAIMSGMSKAYKKGIIVKNGVALEKLSEARSFVFDKTGTITFGLPKVIEAISFSGLSELEIFSIASSLDQYSTHILAKALVKNAEVNTEIELTFPENFKEKFGFGVSGHVGDKKFFFGKKSFLEEHDINFNKESLEEYKLANDRGQMIVFLGDEKKVLGAILFGDLIRPESKRIFKKFADVFKIDLTILTGDKKENAEKTASVLGIQNYVAGASPSDKLEYVKKLQEKNVVVFVGDGVNDAPALMQADVGIAVSGQEKTVSGEVAEVVILSGTLKSVLDVFVISKKTVYLAKQSIFIGMTASFVAMVLSGLGYIQPLGGAILQEFIDVVVIVNALRLGSILKD